MLLYERDVELARLGRALHNAARLKLGGVVLVSGEAGIGKTSLLRAARPPGAEWLWTGCEALSTPRPFGPLADLGERFDEPLRSALAGGSGALALFPALVAALRERVLVIEDLHWADHATLDFVLHLGRRARELPALLLLSCRDDELPLAHPLRQVLAELPAASLQRLPLAPLTPAAVAQWAAQRSVPADGLHHATGGNPHFVAETLGDGGAHALPLSIRDAVWARLARLPEATRAALEILSVVPGRIEPWLVEALLGPEPAALDAAFQRGLLDGAAAGIAFRHDLTRRATEESVAPARRAALHRRVLQQLSARAAAAPVPAAAPPPEHRRATAGVDTAGAPTPPPISAARLLHHALAGQADDAQVLAQARAAAREAARLGSHREAVAHLAAALRVAHACSPAEQAQLHEHWAYESALAVGINDAVLAARHRAIELWRACGRLDGVGRNLCALARLHWYLSEPAAAEAQADAAVELLQALPASPELAMAYSIRSQLHMLQDRNDAAIAWGERALAHPAVTAETRIHALNNVGTARLFSGSERGADELRSSLALALEHGFHEHAARAYTNLAEGLVSFKHFEAADRVLAEGLAFCRGHDLHAKTHYLSGWQARLRLDQGRWNDAQQIADAALATPNLTPVMRLPALLVNARLAARRGTPGALQQLEQTHALACQAAAPEAVAAGALALAEAAWLAGDAPTALRWLESAPRSANPWEAGELAVWRLRCSGGPPTQPAGASAWQLELDGDADGAAALWRGIGQPYEQALALLHAGAPDPAAWPAAIEGLERLGAAPALRWARARATAFGIALPRPRRGPYAAARGHARGLTAREAQILEHLVAGHSNAEIAARLARSERTVERHVAALLAKLGVGSRGEAAAWARDEKRRSAR